MACHCRHPAYPLFVLAAVAATLAPAADATTIIVPDEIGSIQAAVDSGADSVLIRPGDYAETPVVARPGVLLFGASSDSTNLPTIAGLRIVIVQSEEYPSTYSFQSLRIAGEVVYDNVREISDIVFTACHLAGGMFQEFGFGDTEDIRFSKCRLNGLFDLIARGSITLDSCHVTGRFQTGVSTALVHARGCTFEGLGAHTALNSEGHGMCRLEGNTVRGYVMGFSVLGDHAIVSGNLVEDCAEAGIYVRGSGVTIERNIVRHCRTGIYATSAGSMFIGDNMITACATGVDVGDASEAQVMGNVVSGCNGDGVFIRNSDGRLYIKVTRNTSSGNARAGYVVDSYTQWGQEWLGNIGCHNGGVGVNWLKADAALVQCNDWFGNAAGNVQGRAPSGDDVSVDPQFCNSQGGDVRLNSASPLVDWPGCGQIGALGVGCGVTATLVQLFAASRVKDGVRVIWEVMEDATASEIWLERSEAADGAAWSRPLTERWFDNGAVIELDRSSEADRAYWYRLVSLEGSETVAIGAPILVEAEAHASFRLVEIAPNPCGGPVRIYFALKRAASIAIDVYDVQGRRVAAPSRGSWPAGVHTVEWDGRTVQGEAAPSGLYFLRYVYPGGQDRRAIIRTR